MRIHIDMETRSLADLPVTGAYKYAADPSTDVICISYAFDDGPTELWTEHTPIPNDLREAAIAPNVEFHAFNVGFERRIWYFVLNQRKGWPLIPIERWYDTQADALAMGFPADLKRCAEALDVEFTKDAQGTRLINLLSKPIGGTNKFRQNKEFFADYLKMYAYCRQDVRVERAVARKLHEETTREGQERKVWMMTERINDAGVPIDSVLVNAMYSLVEVELKDYACNELDILTNGRVRSGTEVKKMNAELDQPLEDFQAPTVKLALTCPLLSDRDTTILKARQVFSNTSTSKYKRMMGAEGKDHYVRDILQYHAAATGRYGGRGIQIQNFPRSAPADADKIAMCVIEPDNYIEDIEKAYGPAQEIAKSMLRSSLRAPRTKVFICYDYSSIEARGTAWTTKDEAQLEGFRSGRDIYMVTAAQMYNKQYDDIDPDGTERQAGKIAVLACGYQGGWRALRDFAVGYGVHWTPLEAHKIVQNFRHVRPNMVNAWQQFDLVAQRAVKNPGEEFTVTGVTPCTFQMLGEHLSMRLPNGKKLWYPNAMIEFLTIPYTTHEGEKKLIERNSITHMWIDSSNRWVRRGIHGGSLFQSYIQAICREIMVEAMLRLEDDGWPINGTVHDEIFSVVEKDDADEKRYHELMTQVPDWAEGFPIDATGWVGRRYRK